MTQSTIRDIFSLAFDEDEANVDPLIIAEFQLTRAELQYLIYKHGHKIATLQSIKPFRTFLIKRWNRIIKTDLIYPHAPHQAATRLCTKVAEIIATQLCVIDNLMLNKKGDKKKLIYALLMPTVDFSYHHMTPINKLKLNEFILTDDDKDFLPVFIMMLEAGNKRSLEFSTHTLRSNHRYDIRPLTEAERQRLLSHSLPIKEYYQAIQKYISLKSTNIGEVLQSFYNKDSLNDTSMMQHIVTYVESLDNEQKNRLYTRSAYCSHHCKNGTFKDVMDYFGEGKSRIQIAHINLHAFLQRHKFNLFAEKQKYMDPLILATAKFKDDMKYSIIAKPTYGETARQRLIDQVYNQTTFHSAIKFMQTAKPLVDYLTAMPDEKIPLFTQLLSEKKLQILFNNPDENHMHLARIWHFLSSSQKKYLIETIEDHDKLQAILNSQSDQDKRTDYEIAINYLKSLFQSHDAVNKTLIHHLLTQINDISRNIKTSELHFLTELVHRSALRLDKPFHKINNLYYTNMVNKLKERSWGERISRKIVNMYHVGLKCMGISAENNSHNTFTRLPLLPYYFFSRSALQEEHAVPDFEDNKTPFISKS